MERREGRARHRMYISSVFSLFFFPSSATVSWGEGGLSLSFFTGGWGPSYDWLGWSGAMEKGI